MNRGAIVASKFLDSLGIVHANDMTIEDIAMSVGLYIQSCSMDGAEGRITVSGDDGIISFNSSITYYPKIRFIVAHELGHFLMHKQLMSIFTDDDNTLSEWLAKGKHELEANAFAAELLMPSGSFISQCKGKFGMGLIRELSEQYQTSLTATLLRYKELGSFPIALIYSEDRVVRWTQFSHDFVLQYIPIRSALPVNTVAYDISNGHAVPEEPELVDAINWFPEDYNIKKYLRWKFHEQCFRIGQNGVLSCLWGY